MGVAGKAHQGVELLGLCVHQHLAGEARAELGYAYGAGLADDGVVVGQTQRLGGAEDAPRLRVVQRYLAHVDAGHVLEHLEHGRVIVTQLVELEEVVLHAVVFKVGGDDAAARVVGGVLHGAEVLDLHVLRDDDQTSRVLTRRALYADKSRCQAALLGLGDVHAALLQVLEHIAVGGLFRQRADGAGAEHVVGAEKFLGVLVRLGLVLAGEVEVDIRHLVAAEAQEGLERDVEALLAHPGAADRAVSVGHVRAAAVVLAGLEVRVVAARADVVRRQRVDLRDAGHVRHDAGADAASAADQVAVGVGVRDQLLRGHVYDVVVAREYVVQLGLDALGDYLGRVLAVYLVHLAVDQVFQLAVGVLYLGREQAVGQELYLFAHIRYLVRVADDRLVALALAEVGELLEHLVGRAEIERVRPVGVGELLGREQYAAVDLVARVEKVHVAGGDDGLLQLVRQARHAPVQIAQTLVVAHRAVLHQEAVVGDGHDLEVVVEAGDAL